VQRLRPSHSNDEGLDELNEVYMPPFKPFNEGFGFAVGFMEFQTYGQSPDPKATRRDDVGKFKFEYIMSDDKGNRNSTLIDLQQCDSSPLSGEFGHKINATSFLCTAPIAKELFGMQGAFSTNSSHF